MPGQITGPRQYDNWRPLALVVATILVHLVASLSAVFAFEFWPWLLAIVFMNHVVLATLGLSPRNCWLCTNLICLPADAVARNEIALTFDDGPDPDVTPRVLAILDQFQVKATFFCIGRQAARYPEICRAIIQRGHMIENHTQHHRHTFSFLGTTGYIREIQSAQESHGRTAFSSAREPSTRRSSSFVSRLSMIRPNRGSTSAASRPIE